MLHSHPFSSEGERQESILVDGLLQDGADRSAPWRAHLRELTMARQAAERRYSRAGLPAGLDGQTQLALTRERAVAFRGELARIDAEHRTWMREHGIDMVERLVSRRRSPRAAQQ